LLTSLDVSGSNIDDGAVPFIMKSITQHGSWWRRAALYGRLPNLPRTSFRKLSLTSECPLVFSISRHLYTFSLPSHVLICQTI
jgi:hypothetical protein